MESVEGNAKSSEMQFGTVDVGAGASAQFPNTLPPATQTIRYNSSLKLSPLRAIHNHYERRARAVVFFRRKTRLEAPSQLFVPKLL